MRRTAATRRLRAALFLGIGLGMTGFVLVAYGAGVFNGLELDTVDTRFAVRGDRPAPREVIVVDIDDATFDDLDLQWPWRRALHGQVIDRLRSAGARAIAFDVQFTEPSRFGIEDDNALIEAVARTPNVVLASTEVDEAGGTNVFGGDDVVADIGARVGNSVVATDEGEVFRRFTHTVEKLESFPVAVAEVVTGEQVPPSDFDEGEAWIDYHGGPGTIDTVSYSQVLRGRVPAERFRGRIAVVGASASTQQDTHPTSTSGSELMSGPEIWANAILTVLNGFPLESPPDALDVALILVLGLLVPLAGLRLPLGWTLALAVSTGVAYTIATQVAFQQGTVLSFVYPLGALVLSSIGALGAHYVMAAFERERVRDVFSRFVPEQVVGQVLARTDRDLRLGGVDLEVTAIFTDIRGFTSFSETRNAADVIIVVNRYLTELTEAVLAHGGTVVSYEGDGLLAVFGAPLEQDDHADRAIAAAEEILEERLPSFNRWLRDEDYFPDGFRIGIGMNTGHVHSGNVGSERRLEYTVIGDTVNTASRLQTMTKEVPYMLLIGESTVAALQRQRDDLVFVGEFPVRGRQEPIKLWSLPPEQAPAAAPAPVAPDAAAAAAPAP
jgi:adenylate cyclase